MNVTDKKNIICSLTSSLENYLCCTECKRSSELLLYPCGHLCCGECRRRNENYTCCTCNRPVGNITQKQTNVLSSVQEFVRVLKTSTVDAVCEELLNFFQPEVKHSKHSTNDSIFDEDSSDVFKFSDLYNPKGDITPASKAVAPESSNKRRKRKKYSKKSKKISDEEGDTYRYKPSVETPPSTKSRPHKGFSPLKTPNKKIKLLTDYVEHLSKEFSKPTSDIVPPKMENLPKGDAEKSVSIPEEQNIPGTRIYTGKKRYIQMFNMESAKRKREETAEGVGINENGQEREQPHKTDKSSFMKDVDDLVHIQTGAGQQTPRKMSVGESDFEAARSDDMSIVSHNKDGGCTTENRVLHRQDNLPVRKRDSFKNVACLNDNILPESKKIFNISGVAPLSQEKSVQYEIKSLNDNEKHVLKDDIMGDAKISENFDHDYSKRNVENDKSIAISRKSVEKPVCSALLEENTSSQMKSVASQTTSDLHIALLQREYPEFFRKFFSLNTSTPSDIYSTPADQKRTLTCPCSDTAISEITSSEKKKFNEEGFMNSSVVYSESAEKNLIAERDIVEKTPGTMRNYFSVKTTDKDNKKPEDVEILDDIVPLDEVQGVRKLEEPQQSKIQDIRDLENLQKGETDLEIKVQKAENKKQSIEAQSHGAVASKDLMTPGIRQVLPECTPQKLKAEEADVECSEDIIACTPTDRGEVIINDGTLKKLMDRSSLVAQQRKSLSEKDSRQILGDATNVMEVSGYETPQRSKKLCQAVFSDVKENGYELVENSSTKRKSSGKSSAHRGNNSEGKNVATEKYCFVATGLNSAEMNTIRSFAEKINASYSRELTEETTHLIVKTDEKNRVLRTFKYLQALAKKLRVVTLKWVETCMKKNKIVKEENFIPLDFSGECGPFKAFLAFRRLGDSLSWLKNYAILFENPIPAGCNFDGLQDMMRSTGATVVHTIKEFKRYSKHNIIVVADEADRTILPDKQVTEWLYDYQAVTIQFSWLLEVIGRYRMVPFAGYELVPVPVSYLQQIQFPAEMLIREALSDEEP